MARIHIIETPTRSLETPAFFPVNNFGSSGNDNTPHYWEDIPDMNTMMVNAYHIRESYVWGKLQNDGLHRHYSKDGVFFADSGGFQAKRHQLAIDPLKILRAQESIGADIASTLDMPVFPDDTIYQETHASAIRSSTQNALFAIKNREREDMKIFATIHGNDTKVMINMIDYLNKKANFDGFAIGGLVKKRTDFHKVIDLVYAVRKKIGDKPLHIFGLGGVSMIPLLVYVGADTFDSSAFLTAGSNRIYFRPGRNHTEFQNMKETSYLPCICPVCSNHSFKEVQSERSLIGMHNLWMINGEMRQLKSAIQDNDLESYLEWRFNQNPLINEGFRYAKMKNRGLA